MISLLKIIMSLALLIIVLFLSHRGGLWLFWPAEVKRKIVHVSLGLYALSFPIIFQTSWEVVVLCTVVILLLFMLRYFPFFNDGLGRSLHDVKRFSYGEIFFALAVGLVFVLSKGDISTYILPIAILTLSDAAAALVGLLYGKTMFQIEEGTKSWEGTSFFFLTAWLIALIILLILTDIGRLAVIPIAFLIALFGTLIESLSWKGLDNLFLPLTLYLLTRSVFTLSLNFILWTSFVFAGLFLIGFYLGRRYKLNLHVMFTAITSVFFFWIVGGWANVPGSVGLLMIHFLFRQKGPQLISKQKDDLMVILTMIFLALFWYVIAIFAGYNVYYVFNLSLSLFALYLLVIRTGKLSSLKFLGYVLLSWSIAIAHLGLFASISWQLVIIKIVAAFFIILFAAFIIFYRKQYFEKLCWGKLMIMLLIYSVLGVPPTLCAI